MEKMPNQSNLQVTFSKRRTGLFKKASELSLLCGAEVGVVAFSPGKMVYSFGHPSVESIIEKFLNGDTSAAPTGAGQTIIEANRDNQIGGLNEEIMELEALIADETKASEEIDIAKKIGQQQKWYPPSIEEFNLEELTLFEEALLKFEKEFNEEAKKDVTVGNAESSIPVDPPLMANDGNLFAPGFSFGVHPNSNPLPFVFNNLSTGLSYNSGENATNDISAHVPYVPMAGLVPHDFLGGSHGSNHPSVADPSGGKTSESGNDVFNEPPNK